MTQIKFRKIFAVLAVVLLTTGLLVSQTSATVLSGADCVFTFDLIKTGTNLVGPVAEANQIEMGLTDDGNNVQVEFSNLAAGTFVGRIILNYDFANGPAITSLTLSNSGTTTTNFNQNGVNADAVFTAGNFDIEIVVPAGFTTSGVLSSGSANLDPSLFAVPALNDTWPTYDFYAALMLVNSTGQITGWVFANTVECATAPVPEPSTLLLLGGGLAGLAGVTWRRRKKA